MWSLYGRVHAFAASVNLARLMSVWILRWKIAMRQHSISNRGMQAEQQMLTSEYSEIVTNVLFDCAKYTTDYVVIYIHVLYSKYFRPKLPKQPKQPKKKPVKKGGRPRKEQIDTSSTTPGDSSPDRWREAHPEPEKAKRPRQGKQSSLTPEIVKEVKVTPPSFDPLPQGYMVHEIQLPLHDRPTADKAIVAPELEQSFENNDKFSKILHKLQKCKSYKELQVEP